MNTITERATSRAGFRHRALLYGGRQEFLDGTIPFIESGLNDEQPILVVVGEAKIALLREALGDEADMVQFADMAQVGHNPARIIPAWRDFVDRHSSSKRGARGIGESLWAGRSADEVAECQRHESLLNLAFAGEHGFDLLCPYDTGALAPGIIDELQRSHPSIVHGARERRSDAYPGLEVLGAPCDAPLPDPPADAEQLRVDMRTLAALRAFVRRRAIEAGIDGATIENLVVGVDELACNSIRHGGGEGMVRVWRRSDTLVCEVRDRGRMDVPLAGRERPDPSQPYGRGLWIANQLCDLVQHRSSAAGTVARLHMRCPPAVR